SARDTRFPALEWCCAVRPASACRWPGCTRSSPAPTAMRPTSPRPPRAGGGSTWRPGETPIGHWRHDAGIKVPRGQDVELMLTEAAALFDRAARSPARPPGHRMALAALAAKLTDRGIAPWDRMAAADDEEITEILETAPLRELLTRSAAYPLVVHRQRALY